MSLRPRFTSFCAAVLLGALLLTGDLAQAQSESPAVSGRSVAVPAGAFVRGTSPGLYDTDEMPQRSITVEDFSISATEVTVTEFAHCVADGGCTAGNYLTHDADPQCNYDAEPRADHPMNCVDWLAARAFCAWAGGQLPTEAEWEKAARGVDGRSYPWGERTPSCVLANFSDRDAGPGCGGYGTVPVAQHVDGESPYGASDMSGNLSEWVLDFYAPRYYAAAPDDDPPGPPTGVARVVRGGSWMDDAHVLRTSHRYLASPETASSAIGFRCVFED